MRRPGRSVCRSSTAASAAAEDTSTWKLPTHDEGHIRDAMSRFKQTDLPAGEKKKVARRIAAAAKKHGIDASNFEAEYCKLTKGMVQVSDLAYLIANIACVHDYLESEAAYEGDDSPIPERLAA